MVIWRNRPVKLLLPRQRQASWCLQRGGYTSSIPNRVVKSRSADGTALRGGRVGRCQDPHLRQGHFRLDLAPVAFFSILPDCLGVPPSEAEIRPFVPDPGNAGVGKRMGSAVASAKQGKNTTLHYATFCTGFFHVSSESPTVGGGPIINRRDS